MELHSYVAQVQDQLAAAAALGGDEAQAVAAALTRAAEPALRLALLAAVSAAADEITAALLDTPGTPSVAVRLDDSELRIEVSSTAPDQPASSTRADDGDATARISLRLSESLKADVETAAAGDDVSVNTWLIRAANAALSPGWRGGTRPGGDSQFGPSGRRGGTHRVTGWING